MAKSRFAILKDIDEDFWEQNKELTFISPFSSFKKKKNSSEVMKAIYLLYDHKSKLNESDTPFESRLDDVNKNFLGDANFDWSKYEEIVEAYKEKCVSFVFKELGKKKERVEEVDKTISSLHLDDPEEYKMVIEIEKYKDSLVRKIIELENELEDIVAQQVMEGEYLPSLIESYEISGTD